MQQVVSRFRSGLRTLSLPEPNEPVVTGVTWGRFDHPLTPAFWVSQAWMMEEDIRDEGFELGRTLSEELTACMLGGYGIPAEVGLAAYQRIRPHLQELATSPDAFERILAFLSEPLRIGGRETRYRFANQKARYLSQALPRLVELGHPSLQDVALRAALLELPGVGLKTASWVVRNHRSSDCVAILDVHVVRAGRLMGLFSPEDAPEKNYLRMESNYLKFCAATPVRASVLDAAIWQTMRRFHPQFLKSLVAPTDTGDMVTA